jgi:hypothetical protein
MGAMKPTVPYDIMIECERRGCERGMSPDARRGAAMLVDYGDAKLVEGHDDGAVCDALFAMGETPSTFYNTGEWDAMKKLALDVLKGLGKVAVLAGNAAVCYGLWIVLPA